MHSRLKAKGRKDGRSKRFALIPAEVIHSGNWARASKPCRALLADLAVQYNAHNNGDVCASIRVMKALGWTSPETLRALLTEACYYGFLVQTKRGGLGIGPSLYALGWQRIDPCRDPKTQRCKFDDESLVGVMPSGWKVDKLKFQRRPKKQNASTPRVQAQYAARTRKPNSCNTRVLQR